MNDVDVPQRFLDLARQAAGPAALSEEGLRERFGEPTSVEIEAGQVWRARWEHLHLLVLVLAIDGREVQAAPVTIDPPAEDDHSLIVDGTSTVFGVDATVWAGLTTVVPVRVLDRLLDVWDKETVCWATDTVRGRQASVPVGARQGHDPRSELDPAALFRAELADDLELLRQAPALPVENPGAKHRDLAAILGDKLDLGLLCSSLNMSQPQVMKLLRGQIPLTDDQVELIAHVTALPAEQVRAAVRPLPLELVATVEHPRWRQAWVKRAQRREVSEDEARRSAAYGTFALAARETGGREPNWNERLRQFLHGEDSGGGDA